MFRSLRIYRLKSPWPASESDLSTRLGALAFRPCSPFTERSAGWEAPGLPHDDSLCRRVYGADLLRLRVQSRVLPAAAIREELDNRLLEYRARTGEAPSRRLQRQFRTDIRDELLPKALLKSERLDAFCLPDRQQLAIGTASPTKADLFLDMLRAAFGSDGCELVPLDFKGSLESLLTAIFMGDCPEGFELGQYCRMQDPSDSRTTVTWKDADLDDATIRKHVADGMSLTHLEINYRQVLRCVISRDSGISRIRLTGEEELPADADTDDHPLARQDAGFIITTGAFRGLLQDLDTLLDGVSENDAARVAA